MKRSGIALTHLSSDLVERSIEEAIRAKIIMMRAGPSEYTGHHVDLAGESLLNFGSCSYLGLEVRPELKQGVVDAVGRYGTQFPFAQPFIKCSLYGDLESTLEEMTGGHVLIAPSTTLAHIAALPVLVEPTDAVIVDQFAHASLYTGAKLIRGAPAEILPHNRLDMLADRVVELSKAHKKVWYLLDGLYSMRGDFAPLDDLARLLRELPQLHLYVDDAHCTSWTGKHGRGYTLDRMPDRDRVVVALSLNKAFSAAGGAVVLPSAAQRDAIRWFGGPMLFSGGIQPPMLGAAVASARLHLTSEFDELQRRLRSRIERVHAMAGKLGVPLASDDLTPIAFVPCGRHEFSFSLCHALRRRGFYIAAAVFPAVPYNKSGLRLTISLHNDDRDTDRVMEAIAEEIARIPEIRTIRAVGRGHGPGTKPRAAGRASAHPPVKNPSTPAGAEHPREAPHS
jgi:7-keto-8-aminopelargonate synthetase-like enzyme